MVCVAITWKSKDLKLSYERKFILPSTMSRKIVTIKRYSKSNCYGSFRKRQWSDSIQLWNLNHKNKISAKITHKMNNEITENQLLHTFSCSDNDDDEFEAPNRITYCPASVNSCKKNEDACVWTMNTYRHTSV